jgi:hypothetical protein
MSDGIRNPLNQDTFDKFLENQSKELALREKEIELEREKNAAAQQTEEHGFEYAKAQLAAMERDRQNDRLYKQTTEKKAYNFNNDNPCCCHLPYCFCTKR